MVDFNITFGLQYTHFTQY